MIIGFIPPWLDTSPTYFSPELIAKLRIMFIIGTVVIALTGAWGAYRIISFNNYFAKTEKVLEMTNSIPTEEGREKVEKLLQQKYGLKERGPYSLNFSIIYTPSEGQAGLKGEIWCSEYDATLRLENNQGGYDFVKVESFYYKRGNRELRNFCENTAKKILTDPEFLAIINADPVEYYKKQQASQ